MNPDVTFFLAIILSFIVGRACGWRAAHEMIATECQRLGKFFVNKNVYECKKVKWAHEEPEKEERTHGN